MGLVLGRAAPRLRLLGGRWAAVAWEQDYATRTGRPLVHDLPHLWLDVAGADSAAVRLAYAEALEDRLAASEDALLALARPRRLEVGMHRTMHEELSDDLYCLPCAPSMPVAPTA